jgi:hypothetical protein
MTQQKRKGGILLLPFTCSYHYLPHYGAWKLYNSDQVTVTAPDGTQAWQLQGWTPSASSGLLGGVDEPAPPGTLGSGGDCNFALLTLSPTESYKTIKITVNTVKGAKHQKSCRPRRLVSCLEKPQKKSGSLF